MKTQIIVIETLFSLNFTVELLSKVNNLQSIDQIIDFRPSEYNIDGVPTQVYEVTALVTVKST